MNIALVACAKKKRAGLHPARELYDSVLFRMAFAHASRQCDRVFILSAKHGLLDPDTRVCHYDVALAHLSARARKQWGQKVTEQIECATQKGDVLTLFCGKLYRSNIVATLCARNPIIIPLEGLSIGQQLHWYKQNTPA